MDTIEQNKLIAEFMGAKMRKNGYFYDGITFSTGWNTCRPENMKYHDSWDWLMPVVDKIEALRDEENHQPLVDVHIVQDSATIEGLSSDGVFFTGAGKTKIASTFDVIVQFIQWYNENKQP